MTSNLHKDFQEWLYKKGYSLCKEEHDTYGLAWWSVEDDEAAKVAEDWSEYILEKAGKVVEEKSKATRRNI